MKNLKAVLYSSLGALSATAVAFAQNDGFGNLKDAVGCMCGQLMQLLPVVSMLMVIGAGVVYAAGQMMGAETRARANTWATAMLIGAIIGILIVVVAPAVLETLYGSQSGATFQSGVELCSVGSCTN